MNKFFIYMNFIMIIVNAIQAVADYISKDKVAIFEDTAFVLIAYMFLLHFLKKEDT